MYVIQHNSKCLQWTSLIPNSLVAVQQSITHLSTISPCNFKKQNKINIIRLNANIHVSLHKLTTKKHTFPDLVKLVIQGKFHCNKKLVRNNRERVIIHQFESQYLHLSAQAPWISQAHSIWVLNSSYHFKKRQKHFGQPSQVGCSTLSLLLTRNCNSWFLIWELP